jgi:hypothetical protein
MEYVRKKLERKISFLENSNTVIDLKIYYQVRVEYLLIFCMAYLWNKNISLLDDEDKEYILSKIQRPSIGDILDICRKLDVTSDIFFIRRATESISKYPRVRNEKIGHGYVFEDGVEEYLKALSDIYHTLVEANIPIIKNNYDIVVVDRLEKGFYTGVAYKPDGSEYTTWSCSEKVRQFDLENVYLHNNEGYFRLSPFIEITSEDEIYIFTSIQEPLLGKVKYNKILQTGQFTRDWKDFVEAEITSAGNKRKSSNGTILNVFENNYNKYIDIGIKKKIIDFLTKTQHSVSATIWGHGGVGKTATIQYVCEELSQSYMKKFDYIIFMSAKDRTYNYHLGKVQELSDSITSMEDIIRNINAIMFDLPTADINKIKEYKGQLLLIIDDYETLSSEEKDKVVDFIRNLNPNHHRMIVTTRAYLKIGDEIQTNELNEEQTHKFFVRILENDFSALPVENYKKVINEGENAKRLHFITTGRPLFIFQFAHTLIQHDLAGALKTDIKNTQEAIDFLYGKIYNYLSNTAKDLFVAISLLVSEKDLSNLINKLKYILNLENADEIFSNALLELVKLKIVEIKDDGFFMVYSQEILQKMTDYFDKKDDNFKGITKQRLLQISKDKKLDTEFALLQNADANRLTKNEEEVLSTYRSILNRTLSPLEVKLQAILNMTSYLSTDRGKKESAVFVLEEYNHLFLNEPKFIKMYASYAWTIGSQESKTKAINALLKYCSQNGQLQKDENLELFGLLLTFRSIFNITLKDELKEAFKYREINRTIFNKRSLEIKDEFTQIWNYLGHVYFDFIKKADIATISSSARQNAATGLHQLAEVLIRINKYDKAKNLCEVVLEKFPFHFHPLFASKLIKIDKFLSKGEKLFNKR